MMIGRDSALTAGVGNPEITDAERRLANVVSYGKVVEVDYATTPALVRVGIGDEEDPEGYILTGWLPFSHGRSNEWNPLKIGEAVTVIAEGGELPTATVLPGSIHNEDNPPPGDRGDLYRKKFSDGSVIEYDEATGKMLLTGTPSGAITLKAGGCMIVMSDGVITLKATEIVTDGATRLNKGTRGVVYRGSRDSDGDTNVEGASGVYV